MIQELAALLSLPSPVLALLGGVVAVAILGWLARLSRALTKHEEGCEQYRADTHRTLNRMRVESEERARRLHERLNEGHESINLELKAIHRAVGRLEGVDKS